MPQAHTPLRGGARRCLSMPCVKHKSFRWNGEIDVGRRR
uniref:Uncharacterized protein n=1 Tax=Rhizophora mucronata TaxID=61149 RepID=A0A2P2QNH1_RHIMU